MAESQTYTELRERLSMGVGILVAIGRRRRQTGDLSLGRNIERLVISRELDELEIADHQPIDEDGSDEHEGVDEFHNPEFARNWRFSTMDWPNEVASDWPEWTLPPGAGGSTDS